MKLILAITGASGTKLAIKFANSLPASISLHLVISKSSKKAYELECQKEINIKHKDIKIYENEEIWASIASSSFRADAMIILPCSMNTLAKCACGLSDNLITRAFSCMLKEKKNIILAPREMPFDTIALENMLKLSKLGVYIAPPVLGYYSKQENLEDMEDFLLGKWYDLLKIQNIKYKRWGDERTKL